MRIILFALLVFFLSSATHGQQRQCYTVRAHAWAIDKESLDLFGQTLIDKDKVAAVRIMLSGKAGLFKGEERVYMVSPGFLRSTFRFPGDIRTLWTYAEGIKCR